MTLKEMLERKKELGYSNRKIAELSGVPLGTVMKVFSGATQSPRHETIAALEKVLKPRTIYHPHVEPQVLMETAQPYHADEELYTVDDYYALPQDIRVELIDGRFYYMQAPSYIHQDIILELVVRFKACEKKNPGHCRVHVSPCDVQLDCDQYTMVQPDIIVLCDMNKQKKDVCFGAPDLAVEVLSPSSRAHDGLLKLNKYKDAGVREYWLIDPMTRRVLVHVFETGSFETYTFDDAVPVFISDGLCQIDFRQISEAVSFYEDLP